MGYNDKRKEYEAIFSLLAYKDELSVEKNDQFRDLDWVYIAGQLINNRVVGIAWYTMQNNQLILQNVPSEIKKAFKIIYEGQKIRTQTLRNYVDDIASALTENKVPYVFLKGTILSKVLYEEGMRASNDIDVLVMKEKISKCGNALQEIGYIQGDISESGEIEKVDRKELVFRLMNWGETVPLVKIINKPFATNVNVDINFSLDWLPTGSEVAIKEFIDNAVMYNSVNGIQWASLNIVNFLLHLCVHLYKECVLYEMIEYNKDLQLYKFVDIYAYVRQFNINWEEFVKECFNHKLQQACYLALQYTCEFFPCLCEDERLTGVLKQIKPQQPFSLDDVIDPRNGKNYKWAIPLKHRVFMTKKTAYLKEV